MCTLKDPALVSQRCTHYGKVIEIQDHNVTVTIPQGAVEKGYSVEVEVAASLFGPYKIAKGYTRISSFVWIGSSYSFQKPVKIEIEHHAVVLKESDSLQLCVMEDYLNRSYPEEEMRETSQNLPSYCETGSSFFTYYTYCKYTCIAKKSVEIPDEVAVYQFLPKNYAELDDFIAEISFCCNLKYLRMVCNI